MLKIGEDNGLPCTYASGFVVLFQPDIKKGLDGCLYLLLQHKKGNYWDSPKGILEIGETPLSRAYLETKEESGLSVAHLSPLKRLRHTYSFDYGYNENMCRKKVTMSPALAPNKNAILSDEHSGLDGCFMMMRWKGSLSRIQETASGGFMIKY